MNINRLNYENYFLLYVDGELSAVEMQAVDSFAAENEDLADELNTLLQTKLPSESDDIFDNKSILFRTASDHINSINCEEQFLLFVDDELTEQEKKETFDFVAANPNYLTTFDAIKQTKLPIETIVFPYKDSLFRKAEEKKPVIVMQWWKLAVAAALIGIIALIGVFAPFNYNNSDLAKTKLNNKSFKNSNSPKEPSIDVKKNILEQPIFVQKNKTTTDRTIEVPALQTKQVAPIVDENLIAKTDVPKQKIEQETIAINTNNTISTTNNPTIGSESNAHANRITAVNNRIQPNEETNYVKPAVYKELDTDDERKSLYVGSIEINKDKLRGFLRKASSLFKGKNKAEEEKTEISNSHTLE